MLWSAVLSLAYGDAPILQVIVIIFVTLPIYVDSFAILSYHILARVRKVRVGGVSLTYQSETKD